MFKNMNITNGQFDILAFLSTHPDEEWHVRELARAADISAGSASQGLRTLAAQGLLSSTQKGKMIFYRLRTEKPVIRHFKVFLTLHALENVVTALKDRCDRIILFGSAADGTDGTGSDIDLLVITSEKDEVRDRLRKFKVINDRPLNAVVVTPGELTRLSRSDKAFHDRATTGIVLWRRADG